MPISPHTQDSIVRPYPVGALTDFLRSHVQKDVLARLRVGFSDCELTSLSALATERTQNNVLEPVPLDKFRAPGELLVIPSGLNESLSKGNYLLDEEGAASVMAWARAWGNIYSADYEHAALVQPPIRAPAAAWYNLEMRAEGLFARDLQWLPEAAEDLRTFKYRYWSPAFIKDGKTGRVYVYLNFALTNIPATNRMKTIIDAALAEMSAAAGNPLVSVPAALSTLPVDEPAPVESPPAPVPAAPAVVAASIPSPSVKEPSKMEFLLSLLGLSALPADQQQSAITNAITALRDMRTAVCSLLGLPTSATPQDVTAEVKRLSDMQRGMVQLFSLPANATMESFSTAVGNLKNGAAAISTRAEDLGRFQATVMSALGVSKPEDVDTKLASLKRLDGHVAQMTGKSSLEEQVPTLEAFKDGHKQVSTLSTQVTELQTKVTQLEQGKVEAERDRLIAEYTMNGRLPPGSQEKALSFYNQFGIRGLQAHLEALPSTPAAPGARAEPPNNGRPVTSASVTPVLSKLGAVAGLKPEELKEAAEQHAEDEARRDEFRSIVASVPA